MQKNEKTNKEKSRILMPAHSVVELRYRRKQKKLPEGSFPL